MQSAVSFIGAVLWIVIGAFSYGFHISALNSAQDALTCRAHHGGAAPGMSAAIAARMAKFPSARHVFEPCIAMSETRFGVLTASYPVGGFIGSIYASQLADLRGRKAASSFGSVLVGIGAMVMATSDFFATLLVGRTIIGMGSGLSTVLVPIYLSEISPNSLRGSVGVMNQLAIVTGIFVSQLVSLPFAKPFLWRWIFVFSGCLCGLQLLTSPLMIESPKWTIDHESDRDKSTAEASDPALPSSCSTPAPLAASEISERQNLLDQEEDRHDASSSPEGDAPYSIAAQNHSHVERTGILDLWKMARRDPALAEGLKVVMITQAGHQLCGVLAVLYYSTSIIKSVLPTQAIYISLFMTGFNLLMTFPPIFLIDRWGRKALLLISSSSMSLTSLILGLSINAGIGWLSSLMIILFAASFSVGLGPIPFIILSEVVPSYAISSVGSLGLAFNWSSNFVVGLAFLPMRNWLAKPDEGGDGNVFFIFTVLSTCITILIFKHYSGL